LVDSDSVKLLHIREYEYVDMANQDDPRYRYQRNRQSMLECNKIDNIDKEAIAEFLDAIDPENLTTTFVNEDGETETKSTNTLRTYVYGLKRVAEASETPLVELSAEKVNELLGAIRNGRVDHEGFKNEGYSKAYLRPWQAALRGFYRYYSDLEVDSTEIVLFTQDSTSVDDRDMYTQEEVQALRDAVGNARDKCMLELFFEHWSTYPCYPNPPYQGYKARGRCNRCLLS